MSKLERLSGDSEVDRVPGDAARGATPLDPPVPERLMLTMYREMQRIRLLDTRLIALQRQGRIGFYGACTGQEAVPVAAALAARPTDWVFPALRESPILLVRGFPLAVYVAQVFGTRLDVARGRQMPSHMSGRHANVVSWSSVVGSQLPHAVGAAFAARRLGRDDVALAFMGEGATSTGDFHAAMNFAGVLTAPCVLICQNNQWAISTPARRQTAAETFAAKAQAYGIPADRVDGNDVLAVYRAVQRACEAARAGKGPTFIECLTYRMEAHSTSDDPTRYRSEDEVRSWAAKDPILRLRQLLVDQHLLDDTVDAEMERQMHQEIAEALARAEQSGPPERDSLFRDVYAELPWHLREQWRSLERLPPAENAGP
ncbi:MAG TPA: thiamine pyrophosphate-dependent enzyme [Polyangiaceae bacterium]|nr:thiamine pyrophosphate-dependent enzyme [Polyangiaceae bacterium]